MRSLLLAGLVLLTAAPLYAELPQTVAEKSNFKATSRHADVVAFCEQLAKESPLVRLGELGTSHEGRKLPLVIVADPPVASAAEAAKSGKLVVLAIGNIHAGEVDGKEALLMLARDLATAKERPLLKDLVLVFAPIFNADGNEKVSKENRRSQNGPEEGVGVRANAQGLDLNRDFVKLESPEVRALVRFLNEWSPAVFIDCHTTNGSYHRYTLTYEGPRCPAGDPKIIDYVRDTLLPDAGARLKKATGYDSFFYGNFPFRGGARDRWDTVLPTPRYGTHNVGLRGSIGILSESYTYAPFKDRIQATCGFVRAVCEHVAEKKEDVKKLLASARDARPASIPVRYKSAPQGRPVTIRGYVEEEKDGRRVKTDQPKDYEVTYQGGTEVTLSVKRPYAYLIPPAFTKAIETLQRHGVSAEELREDIEVDVEVYRVDKLARERNTFSGANLTLDVTPRKEARRVEAGTLLVKTDQPLGTLAAFILEPQSLDSLATWGLFDAQLAEGKDYPVLRLPAAAPIVVGAPRPLPGERGAAPTAGGRGGRRGRGFFGGGAGIQRWLDDGEHFVQVKDGKTWKVHAATGRCQPMPAEADHRSKMAQGLQALPTVGRAAQGLVNSPGFRFNPQRTAAVVEHAGDLYHVTVEGKAVRLTKSPGRKELITFSPDGNFVAFVRDNNLFTVDVASQTEKQHTADGSPLVFNGKADWVYFEEVFNRNYQAYWWSPDGSQLIFLRIDDTPVKKFTVFDHIPVRGRVEETAYPKAGDPNPLVRVGTVAAAGGPVHWADLGRYTENAMIVLRGGWRPDSSEAYFYVTDRAQTWLDFCTVPRGGSEVTVLFREKTPAWVDDPGPPTFLSDGSFLLASARSGYNHIYHFARDGKLIRPITSGDWEITQGLFQAPPIVRLDEKEGYVYFTGKRDSAIAEGFYRARLDGGGVERLTKEPGDHRVRLAARGPFFIDTWDNHATPPRVRLIRTDGTPVRWLDSNPVYDPEGAKPKGIEFHQITMPDGFVLDAVVVKPTNFDPKKKYPVWFQTYGGPHAPTVRDSWGAGQGQDRQLADMGFVVFHFDPRSASDRGAKATWTAYRQLGVQELKDIEAAIQWLCKNSWVDAARIGMSGSSYGGFMTAYAMTHSKLFAAGISSAPVTDWHNYDSIYTERYMNTPQENPEGYRKTSVVRAAGNLHGRLLLVHGMMDDNVHLQNAVQFADALQRAGKDFEMMFYPRARHGGFGPHYQQLSLDFMKRVLKP